MPAAGKFLNVFNQHVLNGITLGELGILFSSIDPCILQLLQTLFQKILPIRKTVFTMLDINNKERVCGE
jgi:hypothetical protein